MVGYLSIQTHHQAQFDGFLTFRKTSPFGMSCSRSRKNRSSCGPQPTQRLNWVTILGQLHNTLRTNKLLRNREPRQNDGTDSRTHLVAINHPTHEPTLSNLAWQHQEASKTSQLMISCRNLPVNKDNTNYSQPMVTIRDAKRLSCYKSLHGEKSLRHRSTTIKSFESYFQLETENFVFILCKPLC